MVSVAGFVFAVLITYIGRILGCKCIKVYIYKPVAFDGNHPSIVSFLQSSLKWMVNRSFSILNLTPSALFRFY